MLSRCEKISSSGSEMRKKGVGAVAIRHHGYNPEPLRISLNDIPHLLGERGALYFDQLYKAGKGNEASIASLLESEKGSSQKIWKYCDHDGNWRMLLKPGIKPDISEEIFWNKGSLPEDTDDDDSLGFVRRLNSLTVHYWLGNSNAIMCPSSTDLPDYDLSFGCPAGFKLATNDFIHVNYSAVAWQMLYHLSEGKISDYYPGDMRNNFIKLLKENNIKRILDLGCGEKAEFLTQFLPIAKEADIELYGLNLEKIDRASIPLGINVASGSAEELDLHFGKTSFDLIFCSGVLGQVQFFRKRNKPPIWPWLGERRALVEAMDHSSSIIQKAVAFLSDNPKSAMFIQNFNSFILARRTALEFMGLKVLYWNNEEMHKRQETSLEQMSNLYGSMKQFSQDYENDGYHLEREEARWQKLWHEGANIAVVAKG
jgi:hypothetical protein